MTWSQGKVTPNVFIITKACENPEVAIRWADACYDPIISTYYRLGPEYGTEDDTFGIGWGWNEETTMNDEWNQALEDFGETYTGWQWIQMHVASPASVGYFGMDECLGLFELHPDYLSAKARHGHIPTSATSSHTKYRVIQLFIIPKMKIRLLNFIKLP